MDLIVVRLICVLCSYYPRVLVNAIDQNFLQVFVNPLFATNLVQQRNRNFNERRDHFPQQKICDGRSPRQFISI